MKRPVLHALLLSAVSVVILVPSIASAAGSNGGQAAVSLLNASATLSQTSDTAWTLKKTGEVSSSGQTVTWTITGTQGTTVSGHLVVNGFLTVLNSGAKAATIGNIVVNLQTKWGSGWTTQSSDIADAAHGDAATSALIDPKASSENEGQFTTNTASGKLDFMDANDNTVFSLQPQKTIAPGASVNLLFSAGFDNNTLNLSDGSTVRAEVIVSFGNAGPQQPGAANVDINGSGAIDTDEAWVRSIPARITLTVPAQVAANQSVTLTDTSTDIAATGTATFSNPSFNLSATSGTVTVNYDGGASGGKLTNCAHLKSASSTVTVGSYQFTNFNGIDLQACDTETVGASAVTAGWNNGDLITYIEGSWGTGPANSLLASNYYSVYFSVGDAFVIGDTSKYTEVWDSEQALTAYLPQTATAGVLTGSLLDPTFSSSGSLGGDVAALKLNIDFYDAGILSGSSNIKFGDLLLCNVASPTGLSGMTVRQFLATANSVLGAASTTYSALDVDSIATQLTVSFGGGTPSTWAQEHLFNGACPVWKTGDLTTEDQFDWNLDPSSVLKNNFSKVYGGASLFIGGPTYFIAFTSGQAIINYLPAFGAAFPLTSSISDPTNTSSGIFGGDVLALQLDVDYADAGVLSANSGLKFGDLTLCGLTTNFYGDDVSGLNGKKVRDFLVIDNALLGGSTASGFTAANILDLDDVTWEVSAGFDGGPMGYSPGTPSAFAQQHLRNGACQ